MEQGVRCNPKGPLQAQDCGDAVIARVWGNEWENSEVKFADGLVVRVDGVLRSWSGVLRFPPNLEKKTLCESR